MFSLAIHLTVFLFLSGVKANVMKFDYQIIEGKFRFTEDIEADLGKDTVRIHTPAHNNVLETYLMQDFKTDKQITCYPSLRQCRLRDINRESAVNASVLIESFIYSWNDGINSISDKDSKVVTELNYVDGGEIFNTMLLSEELREFHAKFGYPLYQEKKIPRKAIVLNITTSEEHPVKRNLEQLNNGCNGQTPKKVYGVTRAATCNYLKICKRMIKLGGRHVFADCNNTHVTSPLAYVCVCCPWVTVINPNGDDCRCTKMA